MPLYRIDTRLVYTETQTGELVIEARNAQEVQQKLREWTSESIAVHSQNLVGCEDYRLVTAYVEDIEEIDSQEAVDSIIY